MRAGVLPRPPSSSAGYLVPTHNQPLGSIVKQARGVKGGNSLFSSLEVVRRKRACFAATVSLLGQTSPPLFLPFASLDIHLMGERRSRAGDADPLIVPR